MSFKTIVLWIHVAAGLLWIVTSAGLAVAATALAQEPAERTLLLKRSAAAVNFLGIGCACVIPITGVLNIAAVARTHPQALNGEFVAVLSGKIGLFALMVWALWRAAGIMQAVRDDETAVDGGGYLVSLYGIVASAGAVAILCGLWLAGIR